MDKFDYSNYSGIYSSDSNFTTTNSTTQQNINKQLDFKKRYNKVTLDDLENDEEYQEVAERFLTSVGEKSNDIFEYLRDSDFNLYSGMRRAMQSGKFTEQQKQDYAYLRSRFDNADMGSLKQYFELFKDSALDISTDPTLIAAAFLTPITGGTTLAARLGFTKLGLQAAKNITKAQKAQLRKEGRKQTVKAAGVTGLEAGAWTGLDNHFRQNTELNTDLRNLYSKSELIGSTALGLTAGSILGGFLQRRGLAYESDLRRLYSNDEYREFVKSNLWYNGGRLLDRIKSRTIGSATSRLNTYSKYSPAAKLLGQTIKPDFSQNVFKITDKRLGYSYGEDLNFRRGTYISLRNDALMPIYKDGKILPEDEINVIRILRGADPNKYSKAVQESAINYRNFFNVILNDAQEAGLKPHKIENYFTRSWNREAIESNPELFKQKLIDGKVEIGMKNGKPIIASKDTITEVNAVITEMLNKQNELMSGHAHLLTQSRTFKNLKDNDFEEFLNNNLVEVTTDYALSSAKRIQTEKTFLQPFQRTRAEKLKYEQSLAKSSGTGDAQKFDNSNRRAFENKFIDPIDKELRAAGVKKGLTRLEKKRLKDLYQSVTGQVKYFDSGFVQGAYDGLKLANALAYLPLATLSSLTEVFIPLTKVKVPTYAKGIVDGLKETVSITGEELTQILKTKHNLTTSEIRQEMADVWIAVDESMSDMTNRLAGEGFQNKFAKGIARAFYRLNLLTPWTKTIQLASFSSGKDLIKKNLQQLSKLKKEGVNIDSEIAPLKVQKLKGELFDLNIDIDDGIKWVDSGANVNDNFYTSVKRGAGRFTDTIILPTSRESGRVPTIMTNPRVDIFTQLLRYPTAFGNTVLKNFARGAITDPTANAPRLAAFGILATSVALGTNYWRSTEKNQRRMFNEDNNQKTIVRALQRVGLLGPLEYGVRYTDSLKSRGQNPISATTGIIGPTASDIAQLVMYGKGFESLARKTPGIGLQNIIERYTGINPYSNIIGQARELDTATRKTFKGLAEEAGKSLFAEGGLANKKSLFNRDKNFKGGAIDLDNPVLQVKDIPAERVNPYTGEPYYGLLLEDLPFFNTDTRLKAAEGFNPEEQDEYLLGLAQEQGLKQTAPVIELLVAGVPKIIYGVGKTGYDLITNLAKESIQKPKPINYYHGSNLKLKEVTPMGDRATASDVKDLFQQASYIGKPTEGGLELANFYAKGAGYVNVIGKKQFDEVVKKLYNPRDVSDELKDKVMKEISMRQAFITKAKTERVNRNELARARKEIIDLETLIKPFGSGYISRITPVQRKFLEREGFDGVDVSQDVVAIFRSVPVKSSIRGSLTQRLVDRRNANKSKINE
tara:strand:- start:13976 stop:18019 length:4044 start_codon:yes stop_codon:yes gene_type:complete